MGDSVTNVRDSDSARRQKFLLTLARSQRRGVQKAFPYRNPVCSLYDRAMLLCYRDSYLTLLVLSTVECREFPAVSRGNLHKYLEDLSDGLEKWWGIFPLPRGRGIEPSAVTNVVGYLARPASKRVRKFLVRHVRKGNPVSFPPSGRVWPRFQPLIPTFDRVSMRNILLLHPFYTPQDRRTLWERERNER